MPDDMDTGSAGPKRDWSATLDLDRKTVTNNLVDRFEEVMRQQQECSADLKTLTEEATNKHEFGPLEVNAMKRIAKLRLKDEGGRAREQLTALHRVGLAVGFDLFDWAATH